MKDRPGRGASASNIGDDTLYTNKQRLMLMSPVHGLEILNETMKWLGMFS